MSVPRTTADGSLFAHLPQWARPRESERRGTGSQRLAETTILILLGVLLAVVTVNDLVKQTHVNHRIVADLHTWRTVTGHDYHNVSVFQDLKGYTTHDAVCGNVSPGAPEERTQVCVTLVGPVSGGVRSISGGYYLPPHSENEPSHRYACFGTATGAHLCALSSPPPGSPPTPALRTGLP